MDTELLKTTGLALSDDVREQIDIAYGHLWRAHAWLQGIKRESATDDMYRNFALARLACAIRELGWLGFGGEDELE